ncbi:helicase HerA domain-containing protein [Halosimplex marinum]|uniref:helicase HerA domain-containing protein n=1 Tax=Halosimplex marinum TaxID=3396620 RepID=UPI003F545A8C
MAETESITVADVSDGPCGSGEPGRAVDLPVVELLTGRGFVTGKSGSGKSNTASVVVEKLLDNGFGMLIVDIDGEYYGLKEEYEILHAGADDECDIQVTTEHAEKIATLALEQNVPIILDVSSFLDEDEAADLLTEVSKRLFAKAKKLKQPFLMLVEEVHEWIPQKGSVGECGKMLIKISKRGRKHGLGVVGISQRPADVKKDFITQCDWLVWHRLTWNNDTKVVKRVLDTEYAEAVEDLDDGEAFMMNDWDEDVRRVQFRRKQTFDAGATPGLDDFERPDLKSVSDDLVSELQEISEEKAETEDRIAELREELDEKNSRIAELEAELQDARDMQRMADQFTQALVDHVKGANPGRTEQERMRERRAAANGDQSSFDDAAEWADGSAEATAGADGEEPPLPDETAREDDGYDESAMTWPGDEAARAEAWEGGSDRAEVAEDADADTEPDETTADTSPSADDDAGMFGGMGDAFGDDAQLAESAATDGGTAARTDEGLGGADDAAMTRGFDGVEDDPLGDRATDAFEAGTSTAVDDEAVEDAAAFARELADDLADLEAETRQMLRYYRDHGPGTPTDALFAAGGSDDRTRAYARNRRLRVRGLVEHVGRGRYDYRVPALLRERTDRESVDPFVRQVEHALDGGDHGDVPADESERADEPSQVDEPDRVEDADASTETGAGDVPAEDGTPGGDTANGLDDLRPDDADDDSADDSSLAVDNDEVEILD